MRQEKSTSSLTSSWRFTNQTVKQQFTKRTFFRTALVFSLLAGLALAFILNPYLVTTAQETLTTAHPEGIGEVNQNPAVVSDADLNLPDGAVCNWTSDAVYPIPVQDQATAVAGNTLYSFGGQSNSVFTANSYKFDGTTWTAIAPYPVAVVGAGAVSDGTSIYIIAGVGTGSAFQTAVNRYNPATNTYTPLAPVPTATWNHMTVFLNGKIYKMGGSTAASSTAIVEIYDIASNTWTSGASIPQPTSFGHAYTNGGFIYVAGGLNSTGSVASLKTFRYDPATNTWDDAAIADLPQTRWAGVSSKVGYGSTNAFVIAGGFVNGTALTNVSATVIEWNPATNTWSSNPNMPGARFRSNGGVLGSAFHNVGGGPPNFTGTNTNYKLTCVSNVALINAGTINITSESCGTANGSPDPGETLTVTLPLINTGDISTTNLAVTLAATGGVTNAVTQTYGAVAAGATTTRSFTFTVNPNLACGAPVALTFTVSDGSTNFPTITQNYTTGAFAVSLSENFDSVTAPALPTGWTNVQLSGTGINWVITTNTPDSPPNAAFANEPTTVNASALVSPAVTISSASSQIIFRNRFILEESTTAGTGFDGMVLEFSTNNGSTWTDVITGGGSFVSGGYTDTISTTFMNPLAGRMAWSGNSNGYIDTVVNLPASLNGQSVRFRWVLGTDSSATATGAWVDGVQVLGSRVCQSCGAVCTIQRRGDFNGDGKTDFSVFRLNTGTWYIQPNGTGAPYGVQFGMGGVGSPPDRTQPADFDGDGKSDIAVYRQATGVWYWIRSSDNTMRAYQFGATTQAGGLPDIPVAGDYTGDGKADLAVYRRATGVWYVYDKEMNAFSAVQWGDSMDIPVVGDFDGDCKMDYTVRRTTNQPVTGATQFFIRLSSGGLTSVRWGTNQMQIAIGDYNGDGRSDIGVAELRNNLLYWYVIGLNNNVLVNGIQFGQDNDGVIPGDYDGDNKTDLAVFRFTNSVFYYRSSLNNQQNGFAFGAGGDVPTLLNF